MIYTFDRFKIDTRSRRLISDHSVTPLTPKVYTLLILLLEASGYVVSKADIYDRVWPNTLVTESTLYKVVQRLRLCLHEDEKNPQLIRNVHGFGYQLNCQINLASMTPWKKMRQRLFNFF
ncbi:transcriptional regulator [Marinicella sp. W31]|uniref:winged helix-turn-helix domain-containing protein n=1 Tax=Marinicella sp. W31 TaxID=3023713 RepID=UPI003758435D